MWDGFIGQKRGEVVQHTRNPFTLSPKRDAAFGDNSATKKPTPLLGQGNFFEEAV
jgi:hypothetical protein